MRLLAALYDAKSDLALVLVQELLLERSRINTPATVGEHNWTYRIPAALEALVDDGALRQRFERLRQMTQGTGRFDG